MAFVGADGLVSARKSLGLGTLVGLVMAVLNAVSFFFQTLLSEGAAKDYVDKHKGSSSRRPPPGGPGGPGGRARGVHGMGSLGRGGNVAAAGG